MTDSNQLARPFKLIALDLDGTLLNAAGEVSQTDAQALRAFSRAGGLVVLASGRMTENIRPFYDAIGLDGPTISYNGALAKASSAEGATVILETPLPAPYADALIEYTEREHFHLNYYLDEKLYARQEPNLRRFAELYSAQTGAVFHFVPDLQRFRGCDPTKLIIVTNPTVAGRSDPRHRDELYSVWKRKWGDEVTVMKTNPEYLEFYHREAGKGRALLAVADRYGIDHSLTLAFGDNFNDVSMLRAAGCGVAVANANEETKAAADWVSSLTNNENAVAEALGRLLRPET